MNFDLEFNWCFGFGFLYNKTNNSFIILLPFCLIDIAW